MTKSRIFSAAIAACALMGAAGIGFAPVTAFATPVTLGRTETNTDYVSAGVGGVGSGPGTITVTGVSGNVRKAFLYWHGIDNSASNAVYDNETITFGGSQVTGVSLGDAETNCWFPGSSRAFFADVTSLVPGNGSYSISGLNAKTGHNGNGASLIVLFNDSNPANNRDLVFFEGNDSDIIETGFPPGDTAGWSAALPNINFTGGSVFAQLHVGDGQTSFPDGTITFTGTSPVSFTDNNTLYDGVSVPNAGFSRDITGASLWDIHKFDITAAFGSPGTRTITLNGMIPTGDCHSLVVLMLDLAAGSAPCGNGVVDEGEECDPNGGAGCDGSATCLNDCSCGCTNDFQCNDGSVCTAETCNRGTGECEIDSECPPTPGCNDVCDEAAAQCRTCGHPFRNDACIANAVFVLQGALDLRECDVCLCDVNSSGTVTSTDSLRILRSCINPSVNLNCSQAAGLASGGDSTSKESP